MNATPLKLVIARQCRRYDPPSHPTARDPLPPQDEVDETV
jgi:hypothetical protein